MYRIQFFLYSLFQFFFPSYVRYFYESVVFYNIFTRNKAWQHIHVLHMKIRNECVVCVCVYVLLCVSTLGSGCRCPGVWIMLHVHMGMAARGQYQVSSLCSLHLYLIFCMSCWMQNLLIWLHWLLSTSWGSSCLCFHIRRITRAGVHPITSAYFFV